MITSFFLKNRVKGLLVFGLILLSKSIIFAQIGEDPVVDGFNVEPEVDCITNMLSCLSVKYEPVEISEADAIFAEQLFGFLTHNENEIYSMDHALRGELMHRFLNRINTLRNVKSTCSYGKDRREIASGIQEMYDVLPADDVLKNGMKAYVNNFVVNGNPLKESIIKSLLINFIIACKPQDLASEAKEEFMMYSLQDLIEILYERCGQKITSTDRTLMAITGAKMPSEVSTHVLVDSFMFGLLFLISSGIIITVVLAQDLEHINFGKIFGSALVLPVAVLGFFVIRSCLRYHSARQYKPGADSLL